MFIYRVAKSNILICGWNMRKDVGFDSVVIRQTILPWDQDILATVRNISLDVFNKNFLLKINAEDGTPYWINGYPIPNGRIFNTKKRNALMQNIIQYTGRCRVGLTPEVAKMLGLITAILQSYEKPYQPVKIEPENCLSPENLEYWNTIRARYESYQDTL